MSINDLLLDHIVPRLGRLLLVDPIRLVPVRRLDQSVEALGRGQFLGVLLELVRERLFVQEDVGVAGPWVGERKRGEGRKGDGELWG